MDSNRRQQMIARYTEWSTNPYFDEQTRRELGGLDESEIAARFAGDLVFGTGGARGLLGAGSGRVNRYVIRRITAALADVIWREGTAAVRRGVVIAWDSRHGSAEFARETALVLAARGIRAYIFDAARPTPLLSFAVRRLRAQAGVMITASHNRREYNGYKVYDAAGCQLTPHGCARIAKRMARRARWEVALADEAAARKTGLLRTVGRELDDDYLRAVKEVLLHPALTRGRGGELPIVYTPLHGVGRALTERLLRESGFADLRVVPAQAEPDGDFPTVTMPNPERAEAFAAARALAEESGAALVLASDPDGDRLGVCARDGAGVLRQLSGNEVGLLLLHHRLQWLEQEGRLPARGVVLKSIVSSAQAAPLCAAFGLSLVETPVGFKYIGEQIDALTPEQSFVWGFEESLGYLTGDYARDKDGVAAAALVAETALWAQCAGQTLPDLIEEIGRRFGCFCDAQLPLEFPGHDGPCRRAALMAALRRDERESIGGEAVCARTDFLTGGGCRQFDFPPLDLLRFSFADGSFIMARPSGPEPALRLYFCCGGPDRATAAARQQRLQDDFLAPYAKYLAAEKVNEARPAAHKDAAP